MNYEMEEIVRLSHRADFATAVDWDLELAISLSRYTECAICFECFSPKTHQAQHSCFAHVGAFCGSCMRQHISAQGPVPRCPMPGCSHELTESDIRDFGDENALQSWQQALLARAIPTLGRAITCPQSACGTQIIFDGDDRHAVICPVCSYKFCTDCRMAYHYCVECNAVEALRIRYENWVVNGRAAYHGKISRLKKRASKQETALANARKRYEQLQQDERWKAANCRMCECGRVVQRLSGCSIMRCGYDTDTKRNQQDGCGQKFNWDSARSYVACIGAPPEPKPLPADLTRYQEKNAGHHGDVRCDECHTRIQGLRFRCVHCPAFNVCTECEGNISETHPLDHVFEILEPPTRNDDGLLEYSTDQSSVLPNHPCSSSDPKLTLTSLQVNVESAIVFASCTSSKLLRRAKLGDQLMQCGPIQNVDGYDMIPLHPEGAIESKFVVPAIKLSKRKWESSGSASSSVSRPRV